MELEIMDFVLSVPISTPFTIPNPMPRFADGHVKVNNGLLFAEWYSNSVEHLRWVFLRK